MRKNAILKHAITTAILGGSILSSSTSWAATCFGSTTGNWDSAASWSGCPTSTPGSLDTAYISQNIHLNGVTTTISGLAIGTGAGALDDAGTTGGAITATYVEIGGTINITQNTPITITGTSTNSSQGALDYQSSGTRTFTTNGNLSFTNSGQFINVDSGASLSIVGSSGTPVQLSATNTVNLQGAGTYTINYVHFASGTWTSSASGTFNINNCTVAGSATVPAGWGCTAPGAPTSASVNLLPSNKPIWFAKDLE